MPPRGTPLSRFVDKCVPLPNGCVEWSGARMPAGYGKVRINRVYTYAHRASYEFFVGAIPAGLQIDHLCRNPSCVNPEHLEVVTHRENGLRGTGVSARNAAKTHCPQGHAYSPENTYVNPQGQRRCRQCHREFQRGYKRRRRLAA